MDVALPDGTGLDLVAAVRAADRVGTRLDPALPLIVLSGRCEELDRVRGFETGADDFVAKPFSYGELRRRIEALLRRAGDRRRYGRLRVGELEIDPLAREVRLRGERVRVSAKEFALLLALASEPTRVFTKEELLRDVWGYRSIGSTRTLDSHACRLRHKLAARGDRFVVNVWGVGYRLVDGHAGGGGGMSVAVVVLLAGSLFVALARERRVGVLVAQASHELRGPLSAARLGLHGLDESDSARLAAIDLELRRAALALDDLAAAPRRRRAGERAVVVELGALLAEASGAWCALRRGARRPGGGAAARRAACACTPTGCGSRRRSATSSRTPIEHGGGTVARPRARGRRRPRADRGHGRRPGPPGAGRRAHRRRPRAPRAPRPWPRARRRGSPSATAGGSPARRRRPAPGSCSSSPASRPAPSAGDGAGAARRRARVGRVARPAARRRCARRRR